jgi:hypothetical protein
VALFRHEVIAQIDRVPQTVEVRASDGLTPRDMVSEDSFVGFAIGEDEKTAIITFRTINASPVSLK